MIFYRVLYFWYLSALIINIFTIFARADSAHGQLAQKSIDLIPENILIPQIYTIVRKNQVSLLSHMRPEGVVGNIINAMSILIG